MEKIIIELSPYILLLLGITIFLLLRKLTDIKLSNKIKNDLIELVINLIMKIEMLNPYLSGKDKKIIVIEKINKSFDKSKKNIIEKAFGSVEDFVETAFNLTPLSKKYKDN